MVLEVLALGLGMGVGPPSAALLQVGGQEQPWRQEIQVAIADLHLPLALQVGACSGDRQDREEGEGADTQIPSPPPTLREVPARVRLPHPPGPRAVYSAAPTSSLPSLSHYLSRVLMAPRCTTKTHWPSVKGTKRGSCPFGFPPPQRTLQALGDSVPTDLPFPNSCHPKT